jgi:hypothetical protein
VLGIPALTLFSAFTKDSHIRRVEVKIANDQLGRFVSADTSVVKEQQKSVVTTALGSLATGCGQ